jgi:glycine cleavage system H lipoate-binding protein
MKDLLKNIKEINKEKYNQNWIVILATGDLFFVLGGLLTEYLSAKKLKIYTHINTI